MIAVVLVVGIWITALAQSKGGGPFQVGTAYGLFFSNEQNKAFAGRIVSIYSDGWVKVETLPNINGGVRTTEFLNLATVETAMELTKE
jgi:hypothetical protein